MIIPNSVKVDGRFLPVITNEDGSVSVGETTVVMEPRVKQGLLTIPYDEHLGLWQEQMFKLFESAFHQEKVRISS